MAMIVNNKFQIGELVYLKTDTEQLQRIVFGIELRKGDMTYKLSMGTTISEHYDFEISREKDILIAVE